MDDHELLRAYVQRRSQDAFRELVERHLVMVYGSARRLVRDDHLAQDVAQSVFTALAQKAATLRPPQAVGGWLYNTTRHLAMHALRGEQRRRAREQTAAAMQSLENGPPEDRIIEQLEPAMAELDTGDRDALVLRFLENRSLREVGGELGISEDAARMKVNRALERLRSVFVRQGIGVTSVALAATLASAGNAAVPAGLGASIATTALAGTGAAVTLTQATLTTMNWINAKSVAAIASAAVIAGTGTYFVQQQKIERLRADNQNLLAEQEQLRNDREAAVTAAQGNEDELQRLRKDTRDLPRLRNEIGQLRREIEAGQQQASRQVSPPADPRPPVQSGIEPGTYVPKDQLAFVGYTTPEDALMTATWAMMKGTYEQAHEGLSPEMRDSITNEEQNRQSFETGRSKMEPLFQGMQIMAKKILSDDRVELKVKLDTLPLPYSGDQAPGISVQPMVRVGNEWKIGGSTREHREVWDQDGQIQTFAQ